VPEHAAAPRRQLKSVAIALAFGTAMGFVALLVLNTWLPLIAVAVGWCVVGIYSIILFGVIEPGGNAIGRVLVSSGNSTPSVAQHSEIETMEVRGEYAKAAAAYRAVIDAQPEDVVACEKLGQLAMRQLKDFPTAVWAYQQAERRQPEPRRKLGYALLIAGVYRDNLNDVGKAIVELRKVLDKYPDAPNADRLRSELEEMKTRHFEGTA
jgi:tetratricopeptide (TPR) repeat protein